MSKTLYIIHGLPGSGKSTLAKVLVSHSSQHLEADMFFIECHGEFGSITTYPSAPSAACASGGSRHQ